LKRQYGKSDIAGQTEKDYCRCNGLNLPILYFKHLNNKIALKKRRGVENEEVVR
jgi:hypothetical protein